MFCFNLLGIKSRGFVKLCLVLMLLSQIGTYGYTAKSNLSQLIEPKLRLNAGEYYYNWEIINPPLDNMHCHSPSIVQLPDQTFVACWFYGMGEKDADDVQIRAATGTISPYGEGIRWNQPFVLADTPNFPDLNPVMFVDHQRKLWLIWSTVLANEFEYTIIKYKKSDTLSEKITRFEEHNSLHIHIPNFVNEFTMGMLFLFNHLPSFIPKLQAEIEYKNIQWTIIIIGLMIVIFVFWGGYYFKKKYWDFPVFKTAGYGILVVLFVKVCVVYMVYESLDKRYLYRMGWATRNQPLELSNGTLLLPLYSDSFSSSLIAITKNGGKTWNFSEPIIGFGNIQPSLIQKQDGTIVAYMRDNGYYGKVRKSYSYDEGKTWSKVQSTTIPNSGSSLAVLKLSSGNWVMVNNDLVKGRHQLKISLSMDEGKTWTYHKYLEKGRKYFSSYSYPSLTQTDDGMIHCVYTYSPYPTHKAIKHAYFTESWLMFEPTQLASL